MYFLILLCIVSKFPLGCRNGNLLTIDLISFGDYNGYYLVTTVIHDIFYLQTSAAALKYNLSDLYFLLTDLYLQRHCGPFKNNESEVNPLVNFRNSRKTTAPIGR